MKQKKTIKEIKKEFSESFKAKKTKPIRDFSCYKKKYQKIAAVIWGAIEKQDMISQGWSRKWFYRELTHQIMNLVENELKEEIFKLYAQNPTKKPKLNL